MAKAIRGEMLKVCSKIVAANDIQASAVGGGWEIVAANDLQVSVVGGGGEM
jgi:hypothetical protein